MKKIMLVILGILATGVVLLSFLFWYIGINAIPVGGE